LQLHACVETGHPALHQAGQTAEYNDRQGDESEYADGERAAFHRRFVCRGHDEDALEHLQIVVERDGAHGDGKGYEN